MTCYAAGDSRNTVKQNTQRILLPQGETLALNPQDFSTQTIARVECAGYKVDNLKVTPNSPDRYLSFTGQAEDTISVLLYPYLPTTPEANFQMAVSTTTIIKTPTRDTRTFY
ncbi:hypothetical protein H6F71_14520 [Microcoleus sp. FACHB-61]|uniref:hypothetical protein n=1 Tax=Microcoleus vaginatus TaxID=119532 RepID=UPI0016852F9E|nr:hypothetical protein [Microcoleus sp. FACHB-61]